MSRSDVNDEDNSNDDETNEDPVPTTSKDPTRTSHNMDDLAAIDFNSADAVRQAMKSQYSKASHGFVDQCSQIHIEKKSTVTSPVHPGLSYCKQNGQKIKGHHKNTKPCHVRSVPGCSKSKRRPGRPPKCGPSRKIRKPKFHEIYTGKLSNVVPFKNRRRNYHDSDSESLIYFT